MSVEELGGVRDTPCDSSKSANGILCFHCNGFTACDALSIPLLLSHRASRTPTLAFRTQKYRIFTCLLK